MRAYIARAVRNAGVPSLWQDDAVQDVLVTLWRRNVPESYRVRAIRSAAIDAARKYGYHCRGRRRPVMLPLTIDIPYTHDVDGRLDLEYAAMRLTPGQRLALRRWWWDRRLTDAQRLCLMRARRSLRREAA